MRWLNLLLLITPLIQAVSQGNDSPLTLGSRLRLVQMDTVDQATGEIRFTYPQGRLEGADTVSLMLRPGGVSTQHTIGQDAVRVPIARIIRAEAFTGFARHAGQGALAGLTVGAVMGYLLSDSGASGGAGGQCANVSFLFCPSSPKRSDNRAVRSATFGAAGAVAGAMLGYLIRTERWTPVNLATLRRHLRVE